MRVPGRVRAYPEPLKGKVGRGSAPPRADSGCVENPRAVAHEGWEEP